MVFDPEEYPTGPSLGEPDEPEVEEAEAPDTSSVLYVLRARVDELESDKEALLEQVDTLKVRVDELESDKEDLLMKVDDLKELLAPFAVQLDTGIPGDSTATITVPARAVRKVNAALE